MEVARRAPRPGKPLTRKSPVCTNADVVMGTNIDVVMGTNANIVTVTHDNGE